MTNWEDTVMGIDDLLMAGVDFNKRWAEWLDKALLAQGEISFKAGYEYGFDVGRSISVNESIGHFNSGKEAGIRKVVGSIQQLWKPQHHIYAMALLTHILTAFVVSGKPN